MPIPNLPAYPELWFMIFECVDEDRDHFSMHPILPLLKVCRAWKDCATPLLYRNIEFSLYSSLDWLVIHLIKCSFHDYYPGRWTRSIGIYSVFNEDLEVHQVNANIGALFQYAPNLRSLRIDDWPLSHRELLSLVTTCGSSLSHLELCLDEKCHADICLGLLGQLSIIQTLIIRFDWHLVSVDELTAQMDRAAALDFPSLRHLHLIAVGVTDRLRIRPFLMFLSLCQFALLEHLSIAMHLEQPTSADVFEPFFLAHGPQITRLDVNPAHLLGEVMSHRIPSLLPNLHLLACRTSVPPAAVVPFLPPSLRELHIPLSRGPAARDLLDAIINARPSLTLKTIRLMPIGYSQKEYPDFSWASISSEEPGLVGVVVQRSLSLARKGITLLDAHGFCLQAASAVVSHGC